MGPALKNGAGGGGGDGDDVDNDGNNSLNFLSAEKGPNTVLGALHATLSFTSHRHSLSIHKETEVQIL